MLPAFRREVNSLAHAPIYSLISDVFDCLIDSRYHTRKAVRHELNNSKLLQPFDHNPHPSP